MKETERSTHLFFEVESAHTAPPHVRHHRMPSTIDGENGAVWATPHYAARAKKNCISHIRRRSLPNLVRVRIIPHHVRNRPWNHRVEPGGSTLVVSGSYSHLLHARGSEVAPLRGTREMPNAVCPWGTVSSKRPRPPGLSRQDFAGFNGSAPQSPTEAEYPAHCTHLPGFFPLQRRSATSTPQRASIVCASQSATLCAPAHGSRGSGGEHEATAWCQCRYHIAIGAVEVLTPFANAISRMQLCVRHAAR
ncbi:hypothetical protein PLICRDRAFT_638070 [Plicaturopsis crispa FD-325 SS-3]|nr:hypothetical protein PLICRDRAFT_638070 [Plicaturopsis crispa FD-325 SS-3]